jgi:hypothetical protein
MKKIILFCLFLFTTLLATSQRDSAIPHSDNIYIEGVAITCYKSPYLSIVGERRVPITRTNLDIVLRPVVWLSPIIAKNSFFILQMGISNHINKKLEVGTYFMYLNAFLPRPTDSIIAKNNEGYNSPFALFITTHPFKDNKVSVTVEYLYFIKFNERFGGNSPDKSAFKVSVNYALFQKRTK